jgi:hypothetical protein
LKLNKKKSNPFKRGGLKPTTMKKNILIIALMMASLFITAQVRMSCDKRMDCIWNNITQEYEGCEEYDNNSLFVLSENSSILTHTVDNAQTAYYIKPSTVVEETGGQLTVDTVSDTGHSYRYVFDKPNGFIYILFLDSTEVLRMVRFTIKATW